MDSIILFSDIINLLFLITNLSNNFDFDLDLELLVARNRGLLLRVLIIGQIIASDVPETVRVLTLDGIDSTVEINAPR